MNLRGKSVVALLVSLVLVATLAGGCGKKPVQQISMATANPTGAFYILGAGMAKLLNTHLPKVMNVTAEATVGSVENVKLLASKKVDIAIISSDVTYQGYTGTGVFKEKQPILGLMTLHKSYTHFVVMKNSPIKSISDLKGKRVVTGESGSGNEVKNKAILEALGLTYKDFKPLFLSYNEGADALRDGQADAMLLTIGIPIPALMDLSSTHPIRLLQPTDDEIKTIMTKLPYFKDNVIPANTYKGVDYAVKTVSTPMELAARADLPEDIAYKTVKTLLDNWKEMLSVHDSAKDVSLDSAWKMAIPLHPGAQKYFKEKGLIK